MSIDKSSIFVAFSDFSITKSELFWKNREICIIIYDIRDFSVNESAAVGAGVSSDLSAAVCCRFDAEINQEVFTMKTVNFFGTQISRLILGDNPVNGHSYIESMVSGSEMMDYYTAENTLKLLRRAQELGVKTYMALANDFCMRVYRQFANEGGQMNLMFQTYPAMDLSTNITYMMRYSPKAIYHQGGTLDYMVETGDVQKVKDRIKQLKDTGVPVGMGTHVPEVVIRAEEEDWGADFYMTCLYNARRQQRGQQSGFITGKSKSLVFYPEDKYEMFKVVKQVKKPCLVFKMLAGGQVFYGHKPEEYEDIAREAFREVYENIKPTDAGVIGVYQKNTDQLEQDVRLINEILDKLENHPVNAAL